MPKSRKNFQKKLLINFNIGIWPRILKSTYNSHDIRIISNEKDLLKKGYMEHYEKLNQAKHVLLTWQNDLLLLIS